MSSCSTKRNVGEVERVGSLALGALLLARGILSRRTSSTVLGGLFLYRGLVGHCRGYEMLGIDTRSDAERAPEG